MSTPTDAEIARAQALGRLAARNGVPASECPYTDPVLRLRYTLAYSNGQPAPDTRSKSNS